MVIYTHNYFAMKCLKCGTENMKTAKFCRNCGRELNNTQSVSYNVMDRFPEYGFVPTNFYDWRRPWPARISCVIASILLVGSFCLMVACIVDCFVDRGYRDEYREYFNDYRVETYSYTRMFHGISYSEDLETAVEVAFRDKNRQINQSLIKSCILSVLFGIFLYYGRRRFPEKNNQLRKLADYVQRYRYTGLSEGRNTPVLIFYVKDNKMGLLDVAHYCVFLTAQYDKLEWRETNKYLNAIIGKRKFMIDIYGKELK